jgi:hypothetical protein
MKSFKEFVKEDGMGGGAGESLDRLIQLDQEMFLVLVAKVVNLVCL